PLVFEPWPTGHSELTAPARKLGGPTDFSLSRRISLFPLTQVRSSSFEESIGRADESFDFVCSSEGCLVKNRNGPNDFRFRNAHLPVRVRRPGSALRVRNRYGRKRTRRSACGGESGETGEKVGRSEGNASRVARTERQRFTRLMGHEAPLRV